MSYNAKILLDSVAPCGKRLTTWELTYPRFVHAELMTHRDFSRNAASSRAIPIEKMLERVEIDPAMPVWWGKNQAGMQAREEIEGFDRYNAVTTWLQARDEAVAYARKLSAQGVHKQVVNRIVEPWMFITVLVSATNFDNWFHLRDHPDAQPEIAWVARTMRDLYRTHTPTPLAEGEWHLPLLREEDQDFDLDVKKKVSTGRCARVSYLTHDGRRDIAKDIELHDKLCSGPATGEPGHWSPFEHVAQALATPERSGNFVGFKQYRKEFEHEYYELAR